MEYLLITPQQMIERSILDGNIDVDKYLFCIEQVQLSTIEPLLTTDLYAKIVTDAENDDLAGVYLTIYNDYVVPILKHEAIAQYIEVCSYMVANGGLFKHTAENKEVVNNQEARTLAGKYSNIAQNYVLRWQKYICKTSVPEYKRCHNTQTNLSAGWKL